jgi:hypothetical protein
VILMAALVAAGVMIVAGAEAFQNRSLLRLSCWARLTTGCKPFGPALRLTSHRHMSRALLPWPSCGSPKSRPNEMFP